MRRSLFVLPGLTLIALGFVIARAQAPISSADVGKLVAQDAKYVQDTLGKATLDKKAQRRVRMAALLIAQYAQSGMTKDNPKGAALATLRDRALDLLKAVDGDKLDDARKIAQELTIDIKANAAAKTAPVPLDKQLDFELVMKVFSSERLGGFFNMDQQLEELAALKAPLEPAQAEKVQMQALKAAQIALLAQSYAPEKDNGKKTVKAWNDSAKEMHDAALELAQAVKANQNATINKAADKLTGTCTRCHDIFR